MADLFGVDIAGIVAGALGPGLRPMVYELRGAAGTRTTGELTKGTNQAAATQHDIRGILTDFREDAFDGEIVQLGDRKALVINKTASPDLTREPGPGDQLIDEATVAALAASPNPYPTRYRVVRVLNRDPASATYSLHIRRV